MAGRRAVLFVVLRDPDGGPNRAVIRGAVDYFMGRSGMPDGVMAAHGPLEARVQVRVLVGQPGFAPRRGGGANEGLKVC